MLGESQILDKRGRSLKKNIIIFLDITMTKKNLVLKEKILSLGSAPETG
jgi:hypothetical protein